MLNSEKLESLLLANWTKFMDYKEVMERLSKIASEKLGGTWYVQKLTLSQFRLVSGNKFIIWFEYTVGRGPEEATLTSEFNLDATEFIHIQTV